jgi:ABC-type multidrug transport system fused ATPase/permease subunit
LFFVQFNKFFKSKDIEENNLNNLPIPVCSKNILRTFDKTYAQIEKKKRKTKKQNKVEHLHKKPAPALDESSLDPLNISGVSITHTATEPLRKDIEALRKPTRRSYSMLNQSIVELNPLNKQRTVKEKRLKIEFVMKSIFKMVRVKMIKSVFFLLLVVLIKVASPICMKRFLEGLQNEEPMGNLYKWVIYSTLLNFGQGLFLEKATFNICGCKAMTGQILRSSFYRKITKANYSFIKVTDASFINKMLHYEFEHIINYIGELPKLLTSPILLILSLFYIFVELGRAFLIVLSVFVICLILLNLLKRRSVATLRRYFSSESKKSARIGECIPNIKAVKLNNLEKFFSNKIEKIRKREGKDLMKMHVYDAFSDAIFEGTPLFCSILVIGYMAFITGALEASRAFSIIQLLETLGDPLDAFANSFDRIRAYTAAKRSFQLFLEQVPEKIVTLQKTCNFPRGKVYIKNCNFDFVDQKLMTSLLDKMMGEEIAKMKSKKKKEDILKRIKTFGKDRVKRQETKSLIFSGNFRSNTLTTQWSTAKAKSKEREKEYVTLLHNISVEIEPGQKVCLVGKPGSGFTEFLLSLMSEAKLSNNGIFQMRGSISYLNVRMDNFINGTIRQNILMNASYNPARFKQVLKTLNLNLNNLNGGEYFQVLEGAKNLSTDLQRKVLLARWIYEKKDIYLIDDLFDDMNVMEWNLIYEEVFQKELKYKTVIFMSYTNLQIKVSLVSA